MNEFEIVTVINRPVAKVISAMEDFSRAPEWNPAVAEVRQREGGPLGVGSTVVYVGRFLGRGFESSSNYSAYVPNERFATETTSGPFHLEIDNTFEPVDGATRLTSLYKGESRGSFKLAEPVVYGWPRGSSRRLPRT